MHALQSCVVINLSDLQIDHLSRRGAFKNPLVDRYIHSADRNTISTQTLDVYVDALIKAIVDQYPQKDFRISVLGDVADTPYVQEIKRLHQILGQYPYPVLGYPRGNHSSGVVFGVINRASENYDLIRQLPLLGGGFKLDEHLEGQADDPGDILTQSATMIAVRDIMGLHREMMDPIETIRVNVDRADGKSYCLLGPGSCEEKKVEFTKDYLERNFYTFWKEAPPSQTSVPLWECIINHDVADEREDGRATRVNPLYLQATEIACFKNSKGEEYPLYTINIDGLDHTNLLAAKGAGISEFQVRLIEIFIDKKLKENPRARFRMAGHFSAEDDILKTPWYLPWRERKTKNAREAFYKLLSREEIISYTFGHTHRRNIRDLNQTLKLGRQTPLPSINVASLIDYHPYENVSEPPNGRAATIEHYSFEESEDGICTLKITISYEGLNAQDLTEAQGRTPQVDEAYQKFSKEHGYLRISETVNDLRNKHLKGWIWSHMKRLGDFLEKGLVWAITDHEKWKEYWAHMSLAQYIFDNLTVVSTVNMFNEAFHLMGFMQAVADLIGEEASPGDQAIKAQISGLRTALLEEYIPRHREFEAALSQGERASELKQYNDLFQRAHTYELTRLLTQLSPQSPARAFSIMAGIEASLQEYEVEKRPKSHVPNTLPPIQLTLSEISYG